MLVLAFDPGEVWTGAASLLVDEKKRVITAETCVLHMPSYTFREAIDFLMEGASFAEIVCEDYKVRPVGHQRWSSGQTLRLMGALRYATERSRASTWNVVPPGSATEVPHLAGPLLERWCTEEWNRAPEWEHGLSAWRVLLRYLMKHHSSLLLRMRTAETADTYARTESFLKFRQPYKSRDLSTTTAWWRMPIAER